MGHGNKIHSGILGHFPDHWHTCLRFLLAAVAVEIGSLTLPC
jgi:hypothetical protein